MLSITHLLLLGLVFTLLFKPKSVANLGRTLGEGVRGFKRGLKGEEDIDVTDSVKRIEDDPDADPPPRRR